MCLPGEVDGLDGNRAASWWAIAGWALALWLGLQVLLHFLGGLVGQNMVIRAAFGLVVSMFFAVRMNRLTEVRWGILLAIVPIFAAGRPWIAEPCIVGYLVWANYRLARARVEVPADGWANEDGGAAGRFFTDVRLWSLLVWGLLSQVAAWEAGEWGGRLVSTAKADDGFAWVTSLYVSNGLLLFWLLRKLEGAGLDVDDFIGGRPGMRVVGEGLLVAAVAGFFGNTLSECLLYIVAGFDTGFAESVLKGWAWQPPPTSWKLERFLGVVAIGPIVEELVFRGLVLRRLAARWGNTAAIIVSSAVFGGLHFDQAVGATIAGVAMALLYVRSQTLAVPIAAHMANNFAACLMREYYPETYTVTLVQLYDNLGWNMLILGLSTPAVAYYCYRYWPRRGATWPMVSGRGAVEKV